MKKIKYILILLFVSFAQSQDNMDRLDDIGRMAIAPIVGDIADMPNSAEKMLLNKMNQILSRNGFSSFSNRFIMFPNITILEQEITPTSPPMHAYDLEVTLSIGDNQTQSIYHSVSIETKGVGKNPTKAYVNALKTLSAKNSSIKTLIEKSKNKIIEFYNTECDFILKEATSKSKRKQYDNAIFQLTSIPKVCKSCFEKGQDLAVEVYKSKMENQCMELIAKAQVAKTQNNYSIAANYLVSILPDSNCYKDAQSLLKEIEDHMCAVALGKARGAWSSGNATSASKWLGSISSDSKCATEAKALGNEIKDELKEQEDKEWDFKLKVWNNAVELEKARTQAIRDIGVSYGENQQPTDITWINSRY